MHKQSNAYKCPHCHKYFKYLKSHINEIHRNITFVCDRCDDKFESMRSLQRHIKIVHLFQTPTVDKKVDCDVCKVPVTQRKLNNHIEIQHLIPENLTVPCPFCGVHVKFLPFHLKSHHGHVNIKRDLYPCRKCGRYFQQAEHLQVHNADHEMYPCSLCSQAFTRFLDLGWHFLKHHSLVFNPGKGRHRTKKKTGDENIKIDLAKLKLYSLDLSVSTSRENEKRLIRVEADKVFDHKLANSVNQDVEVDNLVDKVQISEATNEYEDKSNKKYEIESTHRHTGCGISNKEIASSIMNMETERDQIVTVESALNSTLSFPNINGPFKDL